MPGFCHPGKGPMGKDGNECPSSCPVKCGFGEMQCNGGIDWNHCQMPDFCMPAKGPIGNDGMECPAHCPMKCGPEEMHCPGGMDWNGCPEPDIAFLLKVQWEMMEQNALPFAQLNADKMI